MPAAYTRIYFLADYLNRSMEYFKEKTFQDASNAKITGPQYTNRMGCALQNAVYKILYFVSDV